MGMISDAMRVSCEQLYAELAQADGSTVEERVQDVLRVRGWLGDLDSLNDEFRAVILDLLQDKALRKPKKVSEIGKSAADVEKDRWRAETDRLAASGQCGDLLSDKLIGLETPVLAETLPRETYFIPSLGEHIARGDLPSRLAALTELRNQTREEYLHREAGQDLLRAEMFVFDELIRRAGERRGAAAGAEARENA